MFRNPGNFTSVNLYFEDESRFGLFTRNGKSLTAKGVQPICPYQQVFQSLYLFGAFSPIDGDALFMETDCCNAYAFQAFLDELASKKPDELKILVLDNGAFHHASGLQIPQNIELIFIPPYSPEVNPAEAMWKPMKRKFTNKLHNTLDDLSDFITKTTHEITPEIVMSTCGYPYIFEYLNWTV